MATYKLIQDIEAEDKILGPLTLRQFIFALIAIFLGYLCFIAIVKHVIFLLVLFAPPMVFCGFFALPFGRDQPTEIWALAKLRFWFKPRQRVWSQSGVKELVTITVPKKIERVLTNGLSQTEVSSRLQVLAQTLDSRGWAVKHVEPGTTYTPQLANDSSDRLIDLESLPQEVPTSDIVAADDMLDETSNPIARQFDNMINQSAQAHRQELMSQLNNMRAMPATASPQAVDSPWFMSQTLAPSPVAVMTPAAPVVTGAVSNQADSADDSVLSAELAARANSRQVSFGNLRTVRPTGPPEPVAPPEPAGTADPVQTAADEPSGPMTAPDDPAILSLARNDDLNVATLAREAKKNRPGENGSPTEVVISLH